MSNTEALKGKRILIVDDEPDILETLEELLDMCQIDTAPNFETARKFLEKNDYDAAILDIMGVRGYELLEITNRRGIPALMLTAHALNPENLVKSIRAGAHAYVPKEKLSEIEVYLVDIIEARTEGRPEKQGQWFSRLSPYFDKKFGADWKRYDKEFWKEFDKKYVASKDDLGKMMR